MNMSRKERTTIRRKNYRAWKQDHKLQSAQASAGQTQIQDKMQEMRQAEQSIVGASAPSASSAFFLGRNTPFNPNQPADSTALLQRLRSRNPDVTREERLAIARYLEDYADRRLHAQDGEDPEGKEIVCEGIRRELRTGLTRFGIAWPPEEKALPSPSEPALVAPGHSTGPRTEAGLARSSQNARKHGLSSLTSIFVMMPGEDPHEWIELVDDLNREFQPATRTERILVNDMAQSYWLTQRAINLQTSHIEDPKFFALYLRYQTTHHRAYYRALKQLLTLQASRTKTSERPVLYPTLTTQQIELEPQTHQSISELEPARSGAGSPDPRRTPTSGSTNTENCHLQAA
jgi:hypothetical protein